jgi:hypothetical protein
LIASSERLSSPRSGHPRTAGPEQVGCRGRIAGPRPLGAETARAAGLE